MRVLLTGATGFIGARLRHSLAARGHDVLAAVRRAADAHTSEPRLRYIVCDFAQHVREDDWLPHLSQIDAVINTVGIIRESGTQTFDRLHRAAPRALFAACARVGITRVVQLSALGADEHAQTEYHRSKRDADDALLTLIPTAICAQPSLVYGEGGESARLFTRLASLPIVPLPEGGGQRVQPIHVDDVIEVLVRLIEGASAPPRAPLTGPRAVSLREFLVSLRRQLQLGSATFVSLPSWAMDAAAALGGMTGGALLDLDTLSMLRRGNVADPATTTRLLGYPPRSVDDFLAPGAAEAVRLRARLDWLLPILRASVALLWIGTGIVSLGLYPVDQSYELLSRAGVPPPLAPIMLYGAAVLDIVLGALVFFLRGRRRQWLWRAQAGLILFYTAIITLKLPEFWLHPYGPVLKNVPLLAALWLLDALEEKR